jgi:hypothetical protein
LKGSQLGFIGFFMQMDVSADFDSVFKGMLNSNICANDASLYVYSACFFEAKGRLHDADTIYKLGISRLVLWVTFCNLLLILQMVA